MPSKKKFDVEVARRKARDVFWAKGYEAASMEDLLGAMGISRGSFYDTFGSKQGLYVAVLRQYDETNRREVQARLRDTLGPREAIRGLFAAVRAEAVGKRGGRGCFLANAALELTSSRRAAANVVRRAFTETEAFFQDRIRAGQASGEIEPEIDPKATACTLLGLLLGMRVLARTGVPDEVFGAIVEQVERLV